MTVNVRAKVIVVALYARNIDGQTRNALNGHRAGLAAEATEALTEQASVLSEMDGDVMVDGAAVHVDIEASVLQATSDQTAAIQSAWDRGGRRALHRWAEENGVNLAVVGIGDVSSQINGAGSSGLSPGRANVMHYGSAPVDASSINPPRRSGGGRPQSYVGAHEMGHFLGLIDRYAEGPRSQGERGDSSPDPGREQDLMATTRPLTQTPLVESQAPRLMSDQLLFIAEQVINAQGRPSVFIQERNPNQGAGFRPSPQAQYRLAD